VRQSDDGIVGKFPSAGQGIVCKSRREAATRTSEVIVADRGASINFVDARKKREEDIIYHEAAKPQDSKHRGKKAKHKKTIEESRRTKNQIRRRDPK